MGHPDSWATRLCGSFVAGFAPSLRCLRLVGLCVFLVVAFAFDPAVDPGFVEAEAEGGVAEDLVEVAHGEVVVVDVAEGWAGEV